MLGIKKSQNTRDIGQKAEQLACQFLLEQGLTLVERNYQTKGGEIDIVMRDQQYLVFVEVRCRTISRFGSAAETVGQRKQARLIKAASRYLQEKAVNTHQAARFDVMAITRQPEHHSSSTTQPDIEWIKDAFQA